MSGTEENTDNLRAEDGDAETNAADNFIVDGRIVGGPHSDRDEHEPVESPAHDAEVQSREGEK